MFMHGTQVTKIHKKTFTQSIYQFHVNYINGMKQKMLQILCLLIDDFDFLDKENNEYIIIMITIIFYAYLVDSFLNCCHGFRAST